MTVAEKRIKGLIRMRLIVDCFKLVKGQGKSIGIYNLTKNLITNLTQENQKLKNTILSLQGEIAIIKQKLEELA